MEKEKRNRALIVMLVLCVIFVILSVLTAHEKGEMSISEVMRDAVLHEHEKISLFGLFDANPSLVSAFVVTALLLFAALLIRVIVIPKFSMIPGRFQMVLELLVGYFDKLSKTYSPHRNIFLGAYTFCAGIYICIGTLFELLGIQAVNTHGASMTLPAPLADINGAVALGCLSYLVILSGGIASNGLKGIGLTLKEFSLPLSMSFRLFGALLSGLLVTELVYFYIHLSYLLPVVVAVLFTLIHALVQAYVLTLLTAMFYGEVSEKREKKAKKKKE